MLHKNPRFQRYVIREAMLRTEIRNWALEKLTPSPDKPTGPGASAKPSVAFPFGVNLKRLLLVVLIVPMLLMLFFLFHGRPKDHNPEDSGLLTPQEKESSIAAGSASKEISLQKGPVSNKVEARPETAKHHTESAPTAFPPGKAGSPEKQGAAVPQATDSDETPPAKDGKEKAIPGWMRANTPNPVEESVGGNASTDTKPSIEEPKTMPLEGIISSTPFMTTDAGQGNAWKNPIQTSTPFTPTVVYGGLPAEGNIIMATPIIGNVYRIVGVASYFFLDRGPKQAVGDQLVLHDSQGLETFKGGRVRVELLDGSCFFMEEDTHISLISNIGSKKPRVDCYVDLSIGTMRFEEQKKGPQKMILINTPTAQVLFSRAAFTLKVDDRLSRVDVEKGQVDFIGKKPPSIGTVRAAQHAIADNLGVFDVYDSKGKNLKR